MLDTTSGNSRAILDTFQIIAERARLDATSGNIKASWVLIRRFLTEWIPRNRALGK